MQIAQLYTYPIKALRAVELRSSALTAQGFPYDRRFMLLEVVANKDDGSIEHKPVHVGSHPRGVRFFPELRRLPDDGAGAESSSSGGDGGDGEGDVGGGGEILVTYRPADSGEERSIVIPLTPRTEGLEKVDYAMYECSNTAYIMDWKFNEWFSSCFELNMLLIYMGENLRSVQMSTHVSNSTTTGQQAAPISPPPPPPPPPPTSSSTSSSSDTSWFSSLSNLASSARNLVTTTAATSPLPEPQITFADCAPYLIASARSMDDLHHRLDGSGATLMDISKFRPNIIISGAAEPWEEDYWAELTIAGDTRIACVHNCGRCKSINIDYVTGAPGRTVAGQMLKKMQHDRRVDPGMKYSPIFGRYSFLEAACEGRIVTVGDEVRVSRANRERTVFDWPGLCTLPK